MSVLSIPYQVISKLGGRKFILSVLAGGTSLYLTSKGVPPEASYPIIAAAIAGITGITIEDSLVKRVLVRQQQEPPK